MRLLGLFGLTVVATFVGSPPHAEAVFSALSAVSCCHRVDVLSLDPLPGLHAFGVR